MRLLVKVICLLTLAGLLNTPALAEERMIVACSPAKPVAFPGETVTLGAWAVSDQPGALTYDWEADAGKLAGTGREVRWDLSGLGPDTYRATVYVATPTGETEKCLLEVLVQEHGRSADATGWSLLLSGRREKPGYGLYSYILLGSRPTASNRERYLKTIEAYVALVESIMDLEKAGIQPHRLNITYLPATKMPAAGRPSPEWLLDNYDFSLARKVLSAMPGAYRSAGPYIVSHPGPLSNVSRFPDRYLYQDLSLVMPKVVYSYAQAFFNQAGQVRYWEENSIKNLALKLQNTLYITANALPDVAVAMKDVKGMVKLAEQEN